MAGQDENHKRMEMKFDQITKNHTSSIHNIEVQLGQLANTLATRLQGSLPSNVKTNLREQLKAITLWSGKELKNQANDSKELNEEVGEQLAKELVNDKVEEAKGDEVHKKEIPTLLEPPRIPFP